MSQCVAKSIQFVAKQIPTVYIVEVTLWGPPMIYCPILLPCFLNFAFDIFPCTSVRWRPCAQHYPIQNNPAHWTGEHHPSRGRKGKACTVRWWIVTQRNKIKHAPKHIHPSRNIAYLVGNNSWPVCQARKTHPLARRLSGKTKGSIFWLLLSSSSSSCHVREKGGARGVAGRPEGKEKVLCQQLEQDAWPREILVGNSGQKRWSRSRRKNGRWARGWESLWRAGGERSRKRANFSLVDTFYEIFHRNVSLV